MDDMNKCPGAFKFVLIVYYIALKLLQYIMIDFMFYLNKRITEHMKSGSAIYSHVQSCKSCIMENLNTSF